MAEAAHSPAAKVAKLEAQDATNFVTIVDDCPLYSMDHFCVPQHYQDDLEAIVVPHGMILNRIDKLAQLIVEEFGTEPLTALCVLKGAHQFFADLINAIKKMNATSQHSVPLAIDFIRLKSYENMASTETVQIIGGDDLGELRGKNVLIVEDMIDSGRTMVKLLKTLKQYDPRSVRVVSLFVKRTPLSNGYRPDYVGFELPDLFIVGYCLDYNEHFRDLDHAAILNDKGKAKYAV